MIGAMIFAKTMPLLQAVSPELQQAIQEQVQQELRRGRFRYAGPPWNGPGIVGALIPIAFFAMIVLIIFVIARRRQAALQARAEFQKQILDKFSSGKGEVQDTARWMRALAPTPLSAESQNELPDPRILWLRAQLSQRRAAAERVQKIVQWVEVACVTAACLGLGIWLAWSWNGIGDEVADRLGWALFDAWPALWSNLYAYGPVNTPILFSSALAAISLLAIAAVYPLLVRE